MDYNSFGGGGIVHRGLRLTRNFGKSEVLTVQPRSRTGGHGGADRSLQDLLFRGQNAPDRLGVRSDLRAGAPASLVGIAAYQSSERAGQAVRIADLVKLPSG